MFDFAFADGSHTAQDFLRWTFERGKSLFGYGIHRLAIIEGEVVGSYGMYTREQAFQLGRKVIPEILRFYGLLGGMRTLWRGAKAESALPPPPSGRLYICHVGVVPARRGQGIGKALIQDAIQQSRRASPLVPALDVATQNINAKRLYESLGFTILQERPGPQPHLPSHYYMECRDPSTTGTHDR
jgi:GNAT superfamily N-acetyltransferase